MEIMQNWCTNNAKNCVQGILVGDFPHMVIKAYEQYQAGNRSATGNPMCPIGENNAFCTGWDGNNQGVHEYGGCDCSNAINGWTHWTRIRRYCQKHAPSLSGENHPMFGKRYNLDEKSGR